MIEDDFADFHNHASQALNAAWKLAWSIGIAFFYYLSEGCVWMRKLAEPDAPPTWIDMSFYHPVKLKYEKPFDLATNMDSYGMRELQSELILSDCHNLINGAWEI